MAPLLSRLFLLRFLSSSPAGRYSARSWTAQKRLGGQLVYLGRHDSREGAAALADVAVLWQLIRSGGEAGGFAL